MSVVDLNCDMGESFGAYVIGEDEEVIKHVTSSNVACGYHASDPDVMDRTVRLCKKHGVMVGAHPGYPDLSGFGRRYLQMNARELTNSIIYQVGALKGFTDLHGVPLQHVKLHGALYNHMVNEEALFLDLAGALTQAFGPLIFLTLGTRTSSEFKRRCAGEGIRIALEAFPDRAYTDEGELMPRKYEGAVLHDPLIIAERAIRMVQRRGIESAGGRWIPMDLDTLCVHGDNREGIEAARRIRDAARDEGIEVRPLASFMG
jgi:5-oxoprolinase (ATP-hydrolysing) subunit A